MQLISDVAHFIHYMNSTENTFKQQNSGKHPSLADRANTAGVQQLSTVIVNAIPLSYDNQCKYSVSSPDFFAGMPDKKDDISFVKRIIGRVDHKKVEDVVQSMNPLFRKNKEVMRVAMQKDGMSLRFIDDEDLKKDDDIILQAVAQNINAFDFVSSCWKEQLRGNKDFAMKVVARNGQLLKFSCFAEDSEVVFAAVKQHAQAFEYAAEKLRKDKQFILELVKVNMGVAEYLPGEYQNDCALYLDILKHNGLCLQYASSSLKDNEQIVLTAIDNNPAAFAFASERFRDNEKITLGVIEKKDYESLFANASKRLKEDRSFVISALKRNSRVYEFLSPALREDREISNKAIYK